MSIWVVSEIGGGSIKGWFYCEADAKDWLRWEEAMKRLPVGYYTWREIPFLGPK